MRPRSFWSAFAIYGTTWVLVFLAASVVLVVPARARIGPMEALLGLGVLVPAGLLLGLGMAFGLGPTTRTFTYQSPEWFRASLEEALLSLRYRLHSESSSQLTYRRRINILQPLAWFADFVVEMGPDSARVSGPREHLARVGMRLRDAQKRAQGGL